LFLRQPDSFCCYVYFIALLARERFADLLYAALRRHHPGAIGPRRVVPHVLWVAALEVGDPVAVLILMKAHDSPIHRSPVAA